MGKLIYSSNLSNIFSERILIIYFFILIQEIILFVFIQRVVIAEENSSISKFNDDSLLLEIETDKCQYNIGEPIYLKGKITNLSMNMVIISQILDSNFDIYIKSDKDFSLLQYKVFLNEVIQKKNFKSLPPSDSYVFELKLSENYSGFPSRAGHYSLYVTHWNANKEFENMKLWVGKLSSNVIQFDVVAKESK